MDKVPLRESPSQTAGPYVQIGCMPNAAGINGVYREDPGAVTGLENTRELIVTVFDGAGEVVADVMVEIWIDYCDFWARSSLSGGGNGCLFRLPEQVFHEAEVSYVCVWVVARGINLGLHTRIYFPDHHNAADPVFALVDESRRYSLLAQKTDSGYGFDIHLQGEHETVFFDV